MPRPVATRLSALFGLTFDGQWGGGEVGRNEWMGWQALRVTPARINGAVQPGQRRNPGGDLLSQKGNIVGRLQAKRPTMGRSQGECFSSASRRRSASLSLRSSSSVLSAGARDAAGVGLAIRPVSIN